MAIGLGSVSANSQQIQRISQATQLEMSQSMRRLSSGKRIQSASDDAAGLAIGMRLEAQLRGMNVALRNTNDGISLAQTADGTLSQIGSMLQRIRELTVQASNDITSDRSAMQQEVDQLSTEISRTVTGTRFNGMAILSSDQPMQLQLGAEPGDVLSLPTIDLRWVAGGGAVSGAGAAGPPAPTIEPPSDGYGYGSSGQLFIRKLDGTVFPLELEFGETVAWMKWKIEQQVGIHASYQKLIFAGRELADDRTLADYNIQRESTMHLLVNQTPASSSGRGGGLNSAGLQIDVSTGSESATSSLSLIEADIDLVSKTRGLYGAMLSRLDSVVGQLSNSSVHLSAAQERLMDADYAVETMRLARASILQQSSLALLAQANTEGYATLRALLT